MDKKVLLKACNYCAYQERTHTEVRKKLFDLQVFGEEAENIIVYLIENNFLNEERFAKIFAGSKFRVKSWGKNKIKFELKKKGISDYCIKVGLEEIDTEDYFEKLENLIIKKRETAKGDSEFAINKKVADFLIRKGFEPNLVWELIKG